MPRVKTQRIKGVNYIADRVIVKFRQEYQINTKTADSGPTEYGTSFELPGNYLNSVTCPSLADYTEQYQLCRVRKSSVHMEATNIEATYSKSVGVSQLQVGTTAGPTPSATVFLSEQPRTKARYLTPLTGSFSRCKIGMSGSTATAYGDRTPSTAASDIMTTTDIAVGPSSTWFWSFWSQNNLAAGTAETAGTNFRVVIIYEVEFLERKQLTD